MNLNTEEILKKLVDSISSLKGVQSIGISSDITPLPKAGEGDIDIFIYCDEIPKIEHRQALFNQMGNSLHESKVNTFEGGHWGIGDFTLINSVETWMMYFTIKENQKDVEAILNGNYPDRLDNYYYPVGRCAMLQNINIFYDKNNYLSSLKMKLLQYPDKLSNILKEYHFQELDDVEDLERAVSRKDVLFYHFSLDIAIDHYLQALFAINKIYFPSRKRTLQFIENFHIKPKNCGEQLLEVVRLGAFSESIDKSYELWRSMVNELKQL